MPSATLRVSSPRLPQPGTQSVQDGIPTPERGNEGEVQRFGWGRDARSTLETPVKAKALPNHDSRTVAIAFEEPITSIPPSPTAMHTTADDIITIDTP